MQAETCETA